MGRISGDKSRFNKQRRQKIAKREGKSNNFTAWRDVTPKHNKLVDAVVSSKCHVIATMRSKMESTVELCSLRYALPSGVIS